MLARLRGNAFRTGQPGAALRHAQGLAEAGAQGVIPAPKLADRLNKAGPCVAGEKTRSFSRGAALDREQWLSRSMVHCGSGALTGAGSFVPPSTQIGLPIAIPQTLRPKNRLVERFSDSGLSSLKVAAITSAQGKAALSSRPVKHFRSTVDVCSSLHLAQHFPGRFLENGKSFNWRNRASPYGPSSARAASGMGPSDAPIAVLGIETSCDDTGAAVVTSDGRILGECVASQGEVHAAWGGVVPSLARDEHSKAIDRVVDAALDASGLAPQDLAGVAVTIGPGLSLCLRVGVVKARALASQYQLPLIPVHHMEAHALLARLTEGPNAPEFPFLTLLVSGGHNLLMLVHGVGRYTQLGTTMDDAVGEAFDKTARLLGLDITRSGGAAVEQLALEGDPTAYRFSLPLRGRPGCDFSFAGLKTSVARCIEKEAPHAQDVPLRVAPPSDRAVRANIAASFQHVAIQHLQDRTERATAQALQMEPALRSLVVSGGVAANQQVRSSLSRIAEKAGMQLVCPPMRLCTDNGVMVAWAGIERYRLNLFQGPPPAAESPDAHVELRPRWPLGEALETSAQPPRSAKRKRLFPSLTKETAEVLKA